MSILKIYLEKLNNEKTLDEFDIGGLANGAMNAVGAVGSAMIPAAKSMIAKRLVGAALSPASPQVDRAKELQRSKMQLA